MQTNSSGTLRPVRVIYACGMVVAVLVFGVVLLGVVIEARELWREGASTFFADAAGRLVGGALVAFLSAAPYFILAVAARQSSHPASFAVLGTLMLGLQLFLTVKMLFLAHSSTASIGVLFVPFYFMAFAIAVRVVVALARRARLGRADAR